MKIHCRLIAQGFPAEQLFLSLYEPGCREAFERVSLKEGWPDTPQEFCDLVRNRVVAQTEAIRDCTDTAQAATMPDLKVRDLWKAVVSTAICVTCPLGAPQAFLPCGHGLCEQCCWQQSWRPPASTMCRLDRCPACGTFVAFLARLKPPTAGYRALSLDGGGVRGIVSIEILRHVLNTLDLGLEAHQLFDIMVGTSTGTKLIPSNMGPADASRRHHCLYH
jgi:hypothetical protein